MDITTAQAIFDGLLQLLLVPVPILLLLYIARKMWSD
jgi:hypothetical protein